MMSNDREMLNYIHQGTEMGISAIDNIIDHTDSRLRDILAQQREEYKSIHTQSAQMLREKGHEPKTLGTMTKASAGVTSAVKNLVDDSPSKIAQRMIQGSTMGVTTGLTHLHEHSNGDRRVHSLIEKLVSTEQSNIDQLKPFL